MLRTLAAALTLAASPARAGFYEAPAFTVAATHDAFEVRDYAPALEARVRIARGYGGAWEPGFRVLAGYIFGGTASGETIAMTVPVAAHPEAPRLDGAEAWTITFTMPSRYTRETLPPPTDPRVQLVETDGGRYAVRGFTGRATEDRARTELARLEAALTEAGLAPAGPPVVAQFNPPWIPGPFRHNEVMLPL
jgi:hypothetical protein